MTICRRTIVKYKDDTQVTGEEDYYHKMLTFTERTRKNTIIKLDHICMQYIHYVHHDPERMHSIRYRKQTRIRYETHV
jgi:hypothetical protein